MVPDCGFGHDVRAFAATGAEVVGLDIARLKPDGDLLAISFSILITPRKGPPYGCPVDELEALFSPTSGFSTNEATCQRSRPRRKRAGALARKDVSRRCFCA